MGDIYLIRHGTTEANIKKLYYGASDVPLSNEGVDMVAKFALEGKYPSADGADLYTTGMVRTDQTFFLIYGCKEYQVISELREYNFGDFEMKTYEEIKDLPAYQAWVSDEEGLTPCPGAGGESSAVFAGRVEVGFSKLLANHKLPGSEARKSIVICHGGVIAGIMSRCFPDEDKTIYQWLPDPGRGYHIHIEAGEAVSYQAL